MGKVSHRELCTDSCLRDPVQELFISEDLCRERARAFGGAVMKIDRLCPNIVRKRSRGDGSSNERSSALLSGGAIPKNVPQGHFNDDVELGPQRIEERTKNAGQNRRIRTSMVEVESCTFNPSYLHSLLCFTLFLLWF
jgi:hypothetical protein